jgi:hypothetical protein
MRLILVRHGDPDYDKDCLTELGHRQADIVAQRLLEEGIEEIYSSPMGRARQTAQPFAEASGIGKINILDFMKEIRYGREDALYTSGNPWIVSSELMSMGIDLQNPAWREFPNFVENTATTDIDSVMEGTDRWLASLGYELKGSIIAARPRTTGRGPWCFFAMADLRQLFSQEYLTFRSLICAWSSDTFSIHASRHCVSTGAREALLCRYLRWLQRQGTCRLLMRMWKMLL